MGIDFDFAQVEDKLSQLERKVARGITDEALRKGAEVLLNEQLKTVPVKSGKLKESLMVGKISGTGANRKILVGINPAEYESVRYGFYQEHGTRVMLGKKWMKKAWTDSAQNANKAIGATLAKELGG